MEDATVLSFEELRIKNAMRVKRWHPGGIKSWSIAMWGLAMAGEAGECCNAIKKLVRIEEGLPNISEQARQLSTKGEATRAIGEEIADTIIYLDLLAQRCNLNLAALVIAKFNKTSEKYNFPDRLTSVIHASDREEAAR